MLSEDQVAAADLPGNSVEGGGLAVVDLFASLSEMCDRLVTSLLAGDPLDSFLLAAGAVQIVEDHLQRDTVSTRRTGEYIGGLAAPVLQAVAGSAERLRRLRPGERRAFSWCADAAQLRDDLATVVVQGTFDGDGARRAVIAARELRSGVGDLPSALETEVLRMPSCFRSFDMAPADAMQLADDYARVTDEREVLVVGVRTSGSYLAPLVTSALRRRGRNVSTITMRPARPLLPGHRGELARVLSAGGAVAVIDDPPRTGGALRDVVGLLRRCGVPADAITLLLPLYGETVPAVLADHARVELPFPRWQVHERLEPGSVAAALSALLGEPVVEVERITDADAETGRDHLSAVYGVRDRSGAQRTVVALGTGIGYFGRHALAVAAALPDHVPLTYGFHDGLVFREWLPETDRVRRPALCDVPQYADYVAARAAALPASRDSSMLLAGRHSVWETASRLLSRGYGRLGVALRLPMLDPAVRRLCAVGLPSVVDGATGPGLWFRVDGALRKSDADHRAFSNLDRSCYDPVYDLAGVDPGGRDAGFTEALRAAYPTDAERFLLYQLVHLQDRSSGRPRDRRACARAVLRYVAEQFPVPVPAEGPLCAVDLDGVLEGGAFGFSVVTPTAAAALRALACHGFRPVPVTGRCLDEVRERCESFGLPGGVAEYGAVAYDHATGRVEQLVTPEDLELLDRLRALLQAAPDVRVDDDHRFSVRVSRPDRPGPAPAPSLESALTALGADRARLRVIPGRGQTDVIAAATDKGTGLQALASLLGGATAADVHLAVGDAAPDLPMLALARHAYAPGQADAEVRAAGVRALRQPYAAGFSAAVRQVIGHRPGHCARCRQEPPNPRARVLLAILDAQRAGRAGLPGASYRAAVATLRFRR